MKQAKFQTERAWTDCPLRIIGSGNGKASRFVCDRCLEPVNGIYRVKWTSSQAETWVCSACRTLSKPRKPQPEALRKAGHDSERKEMQL